MSAVEDCIVGQVTLVVDSQYHPNITIHGIPLPFDHPFYDEIPKLILTAQDLHDYITKHDNKFKVCHGNFKEKFEGLVKYTGIPVHDENKATEFTGYKESDFGEVLNGKRIHSTVRSVKCVLLLSDGVCCSCYRKTRVTLNAMLKRKEAEVDKYPSVSSRKPHKQMSTEELVCKINLLQQQRKQLTTKNESLLAQNDRLHRDAKEKIRIGGHKLSESDSSDMFSMLETMKEDEKLSNYQSLLMSEQLKYNRLCDKHGMRWHPTIIKWCLYMQAKSPKGYRSSKESGLMSLPSHRTLYDYSHYVKGMLDCFPFAFFFPK